MRGLLLVAAGTLTILNFLGPSRPLFYGRLKPMHELSRVQVTTVDGVTINLPWAMLQPYFTTSGVQGRFRIRYTVAGKLLQLEKL